MTVSLPFHSVIPFLCYLSIPLRWSVPGCRVWLFMVRSSVMKLALFSSLLPNHSGSLVVTETLFHFFYPYHNQISRRISSRCCFKIRGKPLVAVWLGRIVHELSRTCLKVFLPFFLGCVRMRVISNIFFFFWLFGLSMLQAENETSGGKWILCNLVRKALLANVVQQHPRVLTGLKRLI